VLSIRDDYDAWLSDVLKPERRRRRGSRRTSSSSSSISVLALPSRRHSISGGVEGGYPHQKLERRRSLAVPPLAPLRSVAVSAEDAEFARASFLQNRYVYDTV
jgi:hypothetical protein